MVLNHSRVDRRVREMVWNETWGWHLVVPAHIGWLCPRVHTWTDCQKFRRVHLEVSASSEAAVIEQDRDDVFWEP